MKILALYNNECAKELFDWLEEQGHVVVRISEKLDLEWCLKEDFDLAVSYTYRFILTTDVLNALKNNVVNLHNSFLPFNRGAAPNIWSFVDGTPRGVTLHYMDEELDKGYIIAQKLVTDGDGNTLSSSYDNLNRHAIALFKECFSYYRCWPEMKKAPLGKGSYHSLRDTQRITERIDSYDISIDDFLDMIRKMQ